MYNYNYGNYGMNQYNPYANQNTLQEMKQMRDKLDAQIQQAQQPQQIVPNQPTQPTNLTQNFQLAPQSNNNSELESRYAENVDEVKNTFVMKTAIFATKDFSTIWLKDVSGNIRTFDTQEVIERDEKDMQIQALQQELNEMKALISQTAQSIQPKEESQPVTKGRQIKK